MPDLTPDLLCSRTTSSPPLLIQSLASKKPTPIWPQIWRLRITNPPTAGFANDRGGGRRCCLLVGGDGGGRFSSCGDARRRWTEKTMWLQRMGLG
ncbi:hypothetical protein RHMOL_Rhmol09G0139500 [Rhododendron molle]|uniref:Uncharacterized protein n=1 Tax=Rhododendron molle TaxID=49168 RepID=A0ACC0MCZ2_RHOML|nr:hypothetical protein RHMOL_Rhmol09G0139500 [Rhododendron molle]